MVSFKTPMQKSLWWFRGCWMLVALTIAIALLNTPSIAIIALYSAAALFGGTSAEYLEQVKPTIFSDFLWLLVPAALFLFPIALVLHSIRVYRICRTGAVRGT